MRRRSFLKGILGGAAALVAGGTAIKCIGTVSGRFSSSQPNISNIPRSEFPLTKPPFGMGKHWVTMSHGYDGYETYGWKIHKAEELKAEWKRQWPELEEVFRA